MRWRALSLAAVALAVAGSAEAAKRLTLPNGLRVVTRPSWSTEVVAIELLLDVSAADEPEGQEGIRYLVQRLLVRGDEGAEGQSAARRLAAVGGAVDTAVGLDYVEVYALVPAEGFELAVQLVADAVQRVAFAPSEVEAERTGAQELARAARDEPFQETYLAFREALYGHHPYGGLTLGRPDSLKAISREALVSFHHQHYVANRAVLAICGGVGEARAMRAAREFFGGWAEGRPAPERRFPPVVLPASDLVARERPLHRAHVIVGFAAPAAGEPGYYPAQVIDAVLGGGATARVPRRLRDELGLVYSASSFYPTLVGESHLAVYAVTDPQHVSTVKAAVLDLMADLCERPVAAEELSRAKAFLLGSYALSYQRMKDQAYALAWYEILGLGVDFEDRYGEAVRAVTAEQVQETARRVFQRLVLAVTLPTG